VSPLRGSTGWNAAFRGLTSFDHGYSRGRRYAAGSWQRIERRLACAVLILAKLCRDEMDSALEAVVDITIDYKILA
jgi:hypothetical protein